MHVDGGHRQKPIDFQQRHLQNGRLAAILDFLVSGLTLVWLWILTPNFSGKYLCIWVRANWFSVNSFSQWLPGGHIRFFGFWMAWFRQQTQVCFGISVPNFMCISFVAVGRSLTIVSYVAFKMAALWFWTMFNCNPPIAHWHPLLWGGGILVDHWSTISCICRSCACTIGHGTSMGVDFQLCLILYS